jgi:hypothetical protein
MLTQLNRELIQAWRDAAADLGVRLFAPCQWANTSGGYVTLEAYLPDFGGKNGLYLTDIERDGTEELPTNLSKLGDSYRSFDRRHFMETLDDWGWYGETHLKPAWFSGRPWT